MLNKTRLNIAIHLMNNSNDRFPRNISFNERLLHSRKHNIFFEIMKTFPCSFIGELHSTFKVVSSIISSRAKGRLRLQNTEFLNFGFFMNAAFATSLCPPNTCLHLVKCLMCSLEMWFVAMIRFCCDGRPPLVLYFTVSVWKLQKTYTWNCTFSIRFRREFKKRRELSIKIWLDILPTNLEIP